MKVQWATIPIDVLLEIFDRAFIARGYGLQVLDNLSCSLVCRHWSIYAQQRLFRRIGWDRVVPQGTKVSILLAVIDQPTEKARMLAACINNIHLHLSEEFESSVSHDQLARVLSLAPNLRTLDLSINSRITTFTDPLLSTLNSIPSSVTTLNISKGGLGLWDSAEAFLHFFPTARSLVLESSNLPNLPPLSPPARFRLYHCELDFRGPTITEDALTSFLGSSVKTLQIVDIGATLTNDAFLTLCRVYGPSLRSFTYLEIIPEDVVGALQFCTRLERLSVWFLSSALLAALPDTLQRLRFDETNSMQQVIDFIKSRSNLLALSFHAVRVKAGEYVVHPEYPALQAVCQARGIALIDYRYYKVSHFSRFAQTFAN